MTLGSNNKVKWTVPELVLRCLPIILLAALGFLGNYLNIELFFAVSFLFGSIAVWLVVYFYGTTWGTIVAAIAASYTYPLWGHPYAIVIFTLEAFFVSLLLQGHKRRNLVLLDAIYWLVLGMPLVGLFYGAIAIRNDM